MSRVFMAYCGEMRRGEFDWMCLFRYVIFGIFVGAAIGGTVDPNSMYVFWMAAIGASIAVFYKLFVVATAK